MHPLSGADSKSTARPNRNREERDRKIHELRARGLSLRAIAEAVGCSYGLVQRILSAAEPRKKARWAELAAALDELTEKVEKLTPTPEEDERPWELISSLEMTAAALLRQAQRLRRRHRL